MNLKNPPFVIGMPTETVYGLAARIDCPEGIEAIFKLKERPFFDPLIVHVSSIEQAKSLTKEWSPLADLLARKFWPGPLTLVLPKAEAINPMITSGLNTVGIRMPRHPMAIDLIKKEGPLAAPSANKFGRTSPTTAAHVRSEFGNQITVLDGGNCEIGLESTVLLVQEKTISILRKGSISESQIQSVLPEEVQFVVMEEKKMAPGQMKHHYMPKAPLVIIHQEEPDIELIQKKLSELPESVDGVKIVKPTGKLKKIVEMKLPADAVLAARQLYAKMREISELHPDLIIFKKLEIHDHLDWSAIMDRLTKAASLELK
jgi:L-threonylcarbamoyladenylate synthase